MLKSSRYLLRCPTVPIKSKQLRFNSSNKMLEEPGSGACCKTSAEVCKSVAKKPEKKKKILGPPKHPNLKCVDNPCCPDPPKSYDEQFEHLLKHKKRTKFQTTWRECPPVRLQKVSCYEQFPKPKADKEKTSPPAEKC